MAPHPTSTRRRDKMTIRQILDNKTKDRYSVSPDDLVQEVNAYLLVAGEKLTITKRDVIEYLNDHEDFFQDCDIYRRFIYEA
jgi:hypothetical protein